MHRKEKRKVKIKPNKTTYIAILKKKLQIRNWDTSLKS